MMASQDEFGGDRAAFLPQWDFTKGAFVGHVAGQRLVNDVEGIDGTPRDVPIFRLITDDGEPFELWGVVLPEHVGHRVKIEDKGGKEPLGDGRELHTYDVRCATCTAAVVVLILTFRPGAVIAPR